MFIGSLINTRIHLILYNTFLKIPSALTAEMEEKERQKTAEKKKVQSKARKQRMKEKKAEERQKEEEKLKKEKEENEKKWFQNLSDREKVSVRFHVFSEYGVMLR